MMVTYRFTGSKSESLFLQRLNPRKISWTVLYRRMHKKGITEEIDKGSRGQPKISKQQARGAHQKVAAKSR
ncbi:16134_t:CDS:2 [Entrophospora sp. SA101]|nr:16134_t:CDS:2 [Entrophospora sp. SA101]